MGEEDILDWLAAVHARIEQFPTLDIKHSQNCDRKYREDRESECICKTWLVEATIRDLPSAVTQIERLQAENTRLREALEFYAEPRNWEHVRAEGSQLHSWVPRAAIDRSDTEEGGVKPMRGGRCARAALAPKEDGDG